MPMNRVQFQKGLSLPEFMDRYGTEEQCEQALVAARWPSGFACPVCGVMQSRTSFRREGRLYWQCAGCQYQCSVTSGTVFEATKLPLTRWFLAMQLLTQAKNNVSALELTRQLGVSYRTAWLIKHKLLQAKGLMMRTGTAVDATLIAAPSSTKNASGERDPEMHQAKKGNQWYFGMKAHIGVDAHSGLVHTVAGTPANVNDLNMAGALLHGDEEAAFGDAGYQGVHKRPEAQGPIWHVAMRPGKRKLLNPFIEPDFIAERVEKMKASIRAKVEHPFRVIKRQFGFTKVRYRGLAKNTAQLTTLFALSNLWMARRALAGTG